MPLGTWIARVLDEYPTQRQKPLKDNGLAADIRDAFADEVRVIVGDAWPRGRRALCDVNHRLARPHREVGRLTGQRDQRGEVVPGDAAQLAVGRVAQPQGSQAGGIAAVRSAAHVPRLASDSSSR